MLLRHHGMIGVPSGPSLRVLRTRCEGLSAADGTAQIRAARATCCALGLAPSRTRLVPGTSDAWQEFSVVAATAEDALALAEILGLVDVRGVPIRPTTASPR